MGVRLLREGEGQFLSETSPRIGCPCLSSQPYTHTHTERENENVDLRRTGGTGGTRVGKEGRYDKNTLYSRMKL